LLIGPHGINLAIHERMSPPFTALPVGRISQAFNSMQMSRSRAAAPAFYEGTLGFSVVFDGNNKPTEPTRSNFGIPLNCTPQIERAAPALQPVWGETERVEVMQIEGFEGDDVSAQASPLNLGILSVRYPVRGLAAYRTLSADRGVTVVYDADPVAIAEIGTVAILAVRDPDGNITEFYETQAKGK
jgi:catechol 2,3-dioxygenase-like lactoylglutathione lyase family enzyme